MQETPTLRLLYEDEDGLVYVHILEGKLNIHSHIKGEKSLSMLKKARQVSMLIDEMMKEKGVKYLHTWATTDEEDEYNTFLGYTPTGYQITVEGYEGPEIVEYYKEL